MSRDAAEAQNIHPAPGRGDGRDDGPPVGSREAEEHAGPMAALVERASDLVEPIKPKLRGWLHAAMVPASLTMRHRADLPGPHGAGSRGLRGVLRHRLAAVRNERHLPPRHLGDTWRGDPATTRPRQHLPHHRRHLHPLAVQLLPPDQRAVLLWIVWAGALAGIAFRVLWVGAPRWLYTPCYLALGWAPVRYLPDFLHNGGAAVLILVVVSGLLYSAGAVVYALKRPDPSPRWFGFHEVFHALTVAAFTAHYIAISLAVY